MDVEDLYRIAKEKEKDASTMEEAKKCYQEIIDRYDYSPLSYEAAHALDQIDQAHWDCS